MHREISHTEKHFQQESNLPLYFLTGLLGLLIGIDLWPVVASWTAGGGLELPAWPREMFGYRIALLAALLGGVRVLYTSVEGLLEGKVGADLALAVACVAAILFNKPLVAAEVVFIGMVGECLESLTFERAQRALRGIVEVCPRRAWLVRDGQEVRVPTSDIHAGDHVVVKPGDRVPVDGVVSAGRSALDASALTGESVPVDVGPGDEALAGSLNQFGALTIETRRVAEQTVVGRVIELTAQALKDKSALERTADRLVRYFLPVVLGLAALTFAAGVFANYGGPEPGRRGFFEAARLSIDPTLAVLVVACPCALILATPAAVIAALGRLAGTGILIKGGSSLERLAQVSAFAFDKTGTLTEGRLELGDVLGIDGVSPEEVLCVAATAEQKSEHPLARLIVQEASVRQLALEAVSDFQAHPGAGVTAFTSQRSVSLVVGTRRLLEEQGISVPAEAVALLDRLDASGQTSLLVTRAGKVLGALGARDRVRPEAADIVAELRALGIHDIALLTGDRLAVARSLAEGIGIGAVHAQLLPADKAEFIAHWQESGAALPEAPHAHGTARRRVAMMGDGINDAPALARADVGLAVGGTGTDLAAEAGDVVFMGEPLRSLPLLIRLSRETVRIIRQNILFFAFGVNGAGIVLTAWLWPLLTPAAWHEEGPLAAVIYHQLGSLAVLANSMRLLWFGRSSASPAWRRTRQALQDLDTRLSPYFDPHEYFHWLSHHWRPAAGGATLLFLLLYFLSGIIQVGPDEIALVRRFGRLRDENLGPGLHWTWPRPIDRIDRIQPDRVRTVEIGFRAIPGTTPRNAGVGRIDNPSYPGSWSWAAQHRDVIRLIPDEAIMITGDGNLVELQAVVHYTIQNPRRYLFEIDKPEEVLRAAAESVLREAVSSRPFDELLTVDRQRFQESALSQLRQFFGTNAATRSSSSSRRVVRADENEERLGIRIEGLSLVDLHPPYEVVPAYYEVAEAMETRELMINNARAKAQWTERDGEAEALQLVRRAEAEKLSRVLLAQADLDAFLARHQARTQLGAHEEWVLWTETWAALSRGQPLERAYEDYQRRRNEQIARQALLTDFRLFWDALGRALAGREKMIIDADKVPGRRQLLLFDPGKTPLPALAPKRTAPNDGRRREGN